MPTPSCLSTELSHGIRPARFKVLFCMLLAMAAFFGRALPAAAVDSGVLAEESAGLELAGAFCADFSQVEAVAERPELASLLPDLGRLYAGTEIGAREAAVWLGVVALMVRQDEEFYGHLQPRISSPSTEEAAEFFGSYFLPAAAIGLVWLNDRERGLACAEAAAFASLNTLALKCALGMARPNTGEGPVFSGPSLDDDRHAMPSGHTAVAFALATVLGAEHPRYKWLFYAAAVLVGLSRIALEEHWPSNVLAGAVLGLHAGQMVLGCEFTVLKWEF